MITSSASLLRRIVSANSRCSAVNGGVLSSRLAMPITAFIGVRISWLMLARNALLAALAASASSLRRGRRLLLLEELGDVDRGAGLVGEPEQIGGIVARVSAARALRPDGQHSEQRRRAATGSRARREQRHEQRKVIVAALVHDTARLERAQLRRPRASRRRRRQLRRPDRRANRAPAPDAGARPASRRRGAGRRAPCAMSSSSAVRSTSARSSCSRSMIVRTSRANSVNACAEVDRAAVEAAVDEPLHALAQRLEQQGDHERRCDDRQRRLARRSAAAKSHCRRRR